MAKATQTKTFWPALSRLIFGFGTTRVFYLTTEHIAVTAEQNAVKL